MGVSPMDIELGLPEVKLHNNMSLVVLELFAGNHSAKLVN